MPKKRGSKKKGRKGKLRAAELKRLLEEKLRQQKETLENERTTIAHEISGLMSKNFRDEAQAEIIATEVAARKQDAAQSKQFLAKRLAEYEDQIQTLGVQLKETNKDVKVLEKKVATEMARIEDDYSKIKKNLLKAMDNLHTKMSYTNLFRIMHRDFMEACLKTEETRAGVERQNTKTIAGFENRGIVEIKQLKAAAQKELDTFLHTASECYEKTMSRRTQQVIRHNLVLNYYADKAFKEWMKRREKQPLMVRKNSEEDCFEAQRLEGHIAKLEQTLADLTNIRDAELEKSVIFYSCDDRETVVKEKSDELTKQIETCKRRTESINMKNLSFYVKYVKLKSVLSNIASYARNLKKGPPLKDYTEYADVALHIFNFIADYHIEEIV